MQLMALLTGKPECAGAKCLWKIKKTEEKKCKNINYKNLYLAMKIFPK